MSLVTIRNDKLTYGFIEHKPGCVCLAPGADGIHTHTIAIE